MDVDDISGDAFAIPDFYRASELFPLASSENLKLDDLTTSCTNSSRDFYAFMRID